MALLYTNKGTAKESSKAKGSEKIPQILISNNQIRYLRVPQETCKAKIKNWKEIWKKKKNDKRKKPTKAQALKGISNGYCNVHVTAPIIFFSCLISVPCFSLVFFLCSVSFWTVQEELIISNIKQEYTSKGRKESTMID